MPSVGRPPRSVSFSSPDVRAASASPQRASPSDRERAHATASPGSAAPASPHGAGVDATAALPPALAGVPQRRASINPRLVVANAMVPIGAVSLVASTFGYVAAIVSAVDNTGSVKDQNTILGEFAASCALSVGGIGMLIGSDILRRRALAMPERPAVTAPPTPEVASRAAVAAGDGLPASLPV